MAVPLPSHAICCLFSVANGYDQPNHNLVRWWSQRPDIHQIGAALQLRLSQATGDQLKALVEIWSDKEARIGDTDYYLATAYAGIEMPPRPKPTPKSRKQESNT